MHFIEGDLLRLPLVNAIVNPVTKELLGTGRVSTEILRLGGNRLEEELARIRDRNMAARGTAGIEAGEAVSTTAPNMVPQHVIHAVVPDFGSIGDSPANRELLSQTYRNVLAGADELGLTSVAFPVFAGSRLPGSLSPAAVEQITLDALRRANTNVRDIYLVRYREGPRVTLPDAASPAPPPAPTFPLVTGPTTALPAAPGTRPTHAVEDIVGNLLTVPFDAIVNPTDVTLRSREGISNEILEGGGQALDEEIVASYPFGIEVGEAAATTAPGTGAEYVIHVAVPDFRYGSREENERTLRKAYSDALARADHLGLRTIAVPLLSATDPRNGRIDPEDLRGIVRTTLAATPTTSVQQVFVVSQPTAEVPQVSALPAVPLAPPSRWGLSVSHQDWITKLLKKRLRKRAVGPAAATAPRESMAELLAERKQRKAQQDNFRQVVRRSYPRVLHELEITAVEVRGDGDCFFHSVIEMWRDRLSQLLGGREPTPDLLRDWLADLLRRDFTLADSRYAAFFEGATIGSAADQRAVRARIVATIRARGSWDNDTGDTIPQIFAHRAGLPMTMVGLNTYHLGPEGQQPQSYIVYDGGHYRGARAQDRVLRAEQARPIVERIRAEVARQAAPPAARPADEQTLARRRNIYIEEFSRLLTQFDQLFGQLQAGDSEQVRRAANQAADTLLYFDNHIESGLTQPAVDALGDLVGKLGTALAALGKREPAATLVPADSAPSAPRLDGFLQPARQFVDKRGPDALMGLTRDEAGEALAAVLAEAASEGAGSPRQARRNELVTTGLWLLPQAMVNAAHARSLPGIDPGPLNAGEQFGVIDPVTGQVGQGDATPGSTLFVVLGPEAMDLSELRGQDPVSLMFAPGTRFEVIANSVRNDGGRTVLLRHPAPVPVPTQRPIPSAVPTVPSGPSRPLTTAEARTQIDRWLTASRRTLVKVAADEDRTYNGLLRVAADHLRRLNVTTPDDLRGRLGRALQDDRAKEDRGQARYAGLIHESPGQSRTDAWWEYIEHVGVEAGPSQNRDAAARLMVNMLASEFSLPLRLVHPAPGGPQVTDLGPVGSQRYVLVLRDGRYLATEPLPAGPVKPASKPLASISESKPSVMKSPKSGQPTAQRSSRPAQPKTGPADAARRVTDTSYEPTRTGRAWVHHIDGDLLQLPRHVGAIVNAANGGLLGTGGISGQILTRGGKPLTDELKELKRRRNIDVLDAGQAAITSAPNINADHVIHAVAPDFRVVGDSEQTRELLAETYRQALAQADALRLTSVAFPVLAGDIFRGADMTSAEMEEMALNALRHANTNVENVYLVRYRAGRGLRTTLPDARRPADHVVAGVQPLRRGQDLPATDTRRAPVTTTPAEGSGPDAQAPAVVSTPSGFYLRAQGAGGVQDAPEDLVAARAFPPVPGAVVVHAARRPPDRAASRGRPGCCRPRRSMTRCCRALGWRLASFWCWWRAGWARCAGERGWRRPVRWR